MSDANLEALRQLVEAVNAGDVDRVLTYVSEDVEWIPARSAVEGTYRGHAGLREWLEDNQQSFELFEAAVDEIRDLGDRFLVIGRIHVRGRGSGVETDIPVAAIATYRDGKLARYEDFRERDRALAAAGLST